MKDKEVLNTISKLVGKPIPKKENFFKKLDKYSVKENPLKPIKPKKK